MAVAKYKDSNGNIKTLSNVKINSIGNIDEKVLICGENVILNSTTDNSINGKTRALVAKNNSSVEFNAIKIENKTFNYMLNSQGEIVSYRDNYMIPAYCDETIKAIYSDGEIEKKSVINWLGKGYSISRNENTVYLYITCDILENHNKTKWGIIISTKNPADDEMVVGAAGMLDTEINLGTTDKYYTVRFGFNHEASFTKHNTLKFRAYSIIEKDGVNETIYSKVITVQL